MNARFLLGFSVATALLGGPALAHNPAPDALATAGISQVVPIQDVDQAPVALKKICPAYPYDMRREGIQGIVTVDMVVDSTGRVVATELVGTADDQLCALALAAAKEWKFSPASANGKAVTTRVRVPFEFLMPALVAANHR